MQSQGSSKPMGASLISKVPERVCLTASEAY